MAARIATLFILLLSLPTITPSSSPSSLWVCIVGSGIGGSSVAHFLREYSSPSASISIRVFERHGVVGGRMARVNVGGDSFEAGGSILHPKNYHALNYTKLIGLKMRWPNATSASDGRDDDGDFGIWDGKSFVFKTWRVNSKLPFVDKIVSFANTAILFWRYGFSLIRMDNFVQRTVNNFLKYYESTDSRPVFETVDDMLKWAGLYNLTGHTLEEELISIGLSPLLIRELITVITRVNYGQSVSISGLAGAVSLAGSGGGLWSVQGGNWQMASGLLNHSNVDLHLREEIESISNLGNYYELNSSEGNSYKCEVAVVATPLDEVDINFDPPVTIPPRKLQHTHATFVRGLLNPAYFGLGSVEEIPELVGTIEDPGVPFSSISVLKRYNEKEVTYKVFSREAMVDTLLDQIFSVRKETIRINWGAYPHYEAPEAFAPFILDGQDLYYVNAFENAASTMETSAVAAENVVRLILSRHSGLMYSKLSGSESSAVGTGLHWDL
ncbi:farnesylcysteine lyase-like [Syzygium oleosum]|uniref:farnesylcysteine lyase-like n=1 Tax=Syzygium oleosum TaxID=219896 RepID=UPI0011D1E1A9|nr:farnesylcysteine lyase-like [Syzygium oleosum]